MNADYLDRTKYRLNTSFLKEKNLAFTINLVLLKTQLRSKKAGKRGITESKQRWLACLQLTILSLTSYDWKLQIAKKAFADDFSKVLKENYLFTFKSVFKEIWLRWSLEPLAQNQAIHTEE